MHEQPRHDESLDASLIGPYLPAEPLLAQAWVDCLRWAMREPMMLNAFLEAHPDVPVFAISRWPQTPEVRGDPRRQTVEQFLAWFHAQIWGSDHERSDEAP